MRTMSRTGRQLLMLTVACSAAAPARGEQFGVFNAAIDQPRVHVMASLYAAGGGAMVYDNTALDPSDGASTITVQTRSFEAYLDTGASGYLIASDLFQGYTFLGTFYPGLRYQPPGAPAPQYPELATYAGPGGTHNVTFEDVGAIGTGGFYVSQQLHLSVANYPLPDPEDTSKYTALSAGPVRTQGE